MTAPFPTPIPPMVIDRLRAARSIVVLTGAGISAESGIRTFRDTMEGLWKEFDPQTLATPEAFAANPELVSRWYDHRRLGCLAAEPNAGHLALAELERLTTSPARHDGPGAFMLLTQNVDRLHHRAGNHCIHELHGSIIEWRCTRTGRKTEPPPTPFDRFPIPSPFADGALLRPDVVWFGEMLPEEALEAAHAALSTCDVFVSAGTSSVVFPAAGFIDIAGDAGALTIEVNLQPTAVSRRVDFSLLGRCGDILPRIVKNLSVVEPRGSG